MKTSLFYELLGLIYPRICRTCGIKLTSENYYKANICKNCWNSIEKIFPPFCNLCGHPLNKFSFHNRCHACKDLSPYFEFARAVGTYTGVLRHCIHLFKFEYKDDLAEPLSDLLVEYIQKSNNFRNVNLLVPVPLHRTKLRERDFNQAELLVRKINEKLNIPFSANNLYRKRDTKPQMEQNSINIRFKNVLDAFGVLNPQEFFKKKILLIDDIMTTGATVNECSKALREAGASSVYILVLARGNLELRNF